MGQCQSKSLDSTAGMENAMWAGQTVVVSFQGKGRPSFSWHGVQTFKMITLWSNHIKVTGRMFQMPRQCARNDELTHIKVLQRMATLLSQDNRLIQLEWTLWGYSQKLHSQLHDMALTFYPATTLVYCCQPSFH